MLSKKILRLLTIINVLSAHKNGLSKHDLIKIIERKFELSNESFNYKDITFKRDIIDIRTELQIDIIYSRKNDTYCLNSLEINDSRIDLLLNSMAVFSTFLNHSGLPKYILTDKRQTSGLDNFAAISDAIKKGHKVEFSYFKFDSNLFETKKICPLALKESKKRWYVIGVYDFNQEIKAFGLDRISNLTITDTRFKSAIDIDTIYSYYEHSFAMFTDANKERVTLKFDLTDGNYIKSYPIHRSQKIELNDEKNAYIVSLEIKITLDLVMELMSRAWSIEIIEPQSLRQRLQNIFQDASLRNK